MIEDAYDEMPDEELFNYLGCTIHDDRKGHEIPFSKVKEALTLGYMSRLAHSNYIRVLKKCTSVPADKLKLLSEINNPDTDTKGFIAVFAEYPNYVIVALKGSESLMDVINDFKIRPKTVNGIKFHKGFYTL